MRLNVVAKWNVVIKTKRSWLCFSEAFCQKFIFILPNFQNEFYFVFCKIQLPELQVKNFWHLIRMFSLLASISLFIYNLKIVLCIISWPNTNQKVKLWARRVVMSCHPNLSSPRNTTWNIRVIQITNYYQRVGPAGKAVGGWLGQNEFQSGAKYEGTFNEFTEMELATERLSVTDEAELAQFLGKLFKKAAVGYPFQKNG